MIRFIASIFVLLLLAVSGCASVQMHKAPMLTAPIDDEVVVTFLRPAVFFGDGIPVEVWDGEQYIGSLKPGTLIQHKTKPGKHVFIATAENQSFAAGDLESGKQYYLKANIFPGVLTARAALGIVELGDKRLNTWLTELQPVVAFDEDRKVVENEEAASISKAMQQFDAGDVSYSKITPIHAH